MPTERMTVDSHQALVERLARARTQTDELFSILAPGALYQRPIPERHRLIFYLGHLEAFDWNLLLGPLSLEPFNATFDQLFAFGIDPTDGGLPSEPPSAWPAEARVREYVRDARTRLDRAIAACDEAHPALGGGTLLNVAIEHRLMHAETLAYLLHALDASQKRAPSAPDREPAGTPIPPGRSRVPSGRATLGLARDGRFGWDNEFEEVSVDTPSFEIDLTKVSNGQFLEFVRAAGYRERRLWDDADWAWKEQEGLEHPGFWVRETGAYRYRGMFGTRALPLDWPVYVSQAEASAFARWAGRTLPTEAQLHRAAYGTPGGVERAYPWGDEPPTPDRGNFDFQRWEPAPTGSYPAGKSAFGVYDLLGNGWEWTRTPFEPLPGFQPFPFYRGYSANFFDGKHYVMKGGSARTAACMLRRSFRNWFQPHYPHVYAGFRLVSP